MRSCSTHRLILLLSVVDLKSGMAFGFLSCDLPVVGVSVVAGRPMLAFNHCRSASTRLINETGVPQTMEATRSNASSSASRPLPSTSSARKAANRLAPLSGSCADVICVWVQNKEVSLPARLSVGTRAT